MFQILKVLKPKLQIQSSLLIILLSQIASEATLLRIVLPKTVLSAMIQPKVNTFSIINKLPQASMAQLQRLIIYKRQTRQLVTLLTNAFASISTNLKAKRQSMIIKGASITDLLKLPPTVRGNLTMELKQHLVPPNSHEADQWDLNQAVQPPEAALEITAS